jgi:NADH:ubiquinone oxidoreductase subunit D
MATDVQQAEKQLGGIQVESIVETAEGRRDMTLNMGPQHPATHGVLRVVLDLQGENIVNSDVVIGYLHRGIEKLAESRTYTQIIPLTDRTDYMSAMTGNQGFCVAVERLMELEVPARGRYIRTMIAELQRIASHLIWLGTHAMDIGATTVFLYCFRERERILDFFEAFCGARLTYSYYRVGGVMADAPPGVLEQIYGFTTEFVDRLAENEELLTANDLWLARTKGVATISAKDAIAIGLTGPPLRGSGVAYDIRKAEPYDAYRAGVSRGRRVRPLHRAHRRAEAEHPHRAAVHRAHAGRASERGGPDGHATQARGGHDPHGIDDQPLHVEYPQLQRAKRRGVQRD